jgi:hypothetical protein
MYVQLVAFVLLLPAFVSVLIMRHEYFDTHGQFYLTFDEADELQDGPGLVAEYVSRSDKGNYPDRLVLQRGVLHSKGRAYYTSAAYLDLGSVLRQGLFDTIRTVCLEDGTELSHRGDFSGGYSIRGLDTLPSKLLVITERTRDTIIYSMSYAAQDVSLEPPDIPWWFEWRLILLEGHGQRSYR